MAEETAQYLSGLNFKGIYCSDLVRGKKTAEIIAKYHTAQLEVLPELRERHYGAWEGLTFKEIAGQYPALYQTWLKCPAQADIPNAESLPDLQARAVAALQKIIDRHPAADNLCIVGHGGINRAILFHFLNLDLNHFWKIRQSNACINVVELEKRATVSLINGTGHLKKAARETIPIY
jgi:broad specificity phosphatase PhoE